MLKTKLFSKLTQTCVLSLSCLLPASLLHAQEPELLHVQGNVYLFASPEINVTVQIGDESLVFVDTPAPEVIPTMMELISEVALRPARYVINTALDAKRIAGNDVINTMGDRAGVGLFSFGGVNQGAGVAAGGSSAGVTIIGHENVLNRFYLTDHDIPSLTLTTTYFTDTKDFFANGESIVIYHMPNAHTDGDSIVYFRRSDVISTGGIYIPGLYPDIDIEKGGSVDGMVDALNFILELMVPDLFSEGGTYVVPGHGRIGDEIDIVEYRNMIYIVRDRVQDMIDRGMSLQQVLDAKPTFDYDTEYGGHRGGPSSEEFVTAIYSSLTQNN
jgi:glyoxylase-like metal-dependent hydrolase (beta-lactamase superfamily II)